MFRIVLGKSLLQNKILLMQLIIYVFVYTGNRNMKFVRNVLTGNRNIAQRAETIKCGNGLLSTECIGIDDIGTHLILNTAVALLPSDARSHTVINPNHGIGTNSSKKRSNLLE